MAAWAVLTTSILITCPVPDYQKNLQTVRPTQLSLDKPFWQAQVQNREKRWIARIPSDLDLSMQKRLHTIAIVTSGVMCCLLLILLPVSYRLDPSRFDSESKKLVAHDSIAIAPRFHLAIFDGGIWFFSHDVPYTGSMINIGGPDTREVWWGWHTADYGFGQTTFIDKKGDVVRRKRGCDLPGVYFRHFQTHGFADSLWTLMVSLWYPIFLFAALPVLWICRRGRSRFKKPHDA